jgi:hypothetical protein
MASCSKVVAALTSIFLIVACGCGSQSPAPRNGAHSGKPGAPDIQLMDFQFFEGQNSAPGELPSMLIKTTVRNNTTDRTITGILWRIEVYDPAGGKKVEEVEPYTRLGAYTPGTVMSITAGKSVKVGFYIQRTVAQNRPNIKVSIQDYVYKDYKPDQFRREDVESFAAEKWPFDSKTEPIPEGKDKE